MGQPEGRALGIDHGEKRVGLALSDEEGRIAHPLATLERRDHAKLIEQIADIAREREVTTFVVGLPLHLDGSEGASARRARRFAEKLGEKTAITVVLWDERMTTALADRALAEAGVRAKSRKDKVDRVAAALLLQSWLDARAYENERSSAWRADEPAQEDEGADEGEPYAR
jgi:putative Holliday junction resolvase